MVSLLDEDEGWSCNTTTTAQKGHNYLCDRLITLKFLQEFLESVFGGVPMESLHGEDKR
jgi:hypothetical protein